jgi:hypothetical protein
MDDEEESALLDLAMLLLPTALHALKADTPPLLDAATAAARHARVAIFFLRCFREVVSFVIIRLLRMIKSENRDSLPPLLVLCFVSKE